MHRDCISGVASKPKAEAARATRVLRRKLRWRGAQFGAATANREMRTRDYPPRTSTPERASLKTSLPHGDVNDGEEAGKSALARGPLTPTTLSRINDGDVSGKVENWSSKILKMGRKHAQKGVHIGGPPK